MDWRVQDMFMLNGDMFEHGECSHASKVELICIRFPTVKTQSKNIHFIIMKRAVFWSSLSLGIEQAKLDIAYYHMTIEYIRTYELDHVVGDEIAAELARFIIHSLSFLKWAEHD